MAKHGINHRGFPKKVKKVKKKIKRGFGLGR